jgi:TetR/AcrR family transcriptional regulator
MGAAKTLRIKRRASGSQPRAEITRQKILKAALREFSELGLAGARVDKIAARARVNKQILYYHFGNKEMLFGATLASVYNTPFPDELLAPTETKASADAEMGELVSALFKHFRNFEEGTALIGHENLYRAKHLTPTLRKEIRISVSPVIEAIQRVVKRGQRDGAFAPDVSVEKLYLTLVAMTMFYFSHAYTLSAILEKDLLDDDAIAAWKETVAETVLATLRMHRQQPRKGFARAAGV